MTLPCISCHHEITAVIYGYLHKKGPIKFHHGCSHQYAAMSQGYTEDGLELPIILPLLPKYWHNTQAQHPTSTLQFFSTCLKNIKNFLQKLILCNKGQRPNIIKTKGLKYQTVNQKGYQLHENLNSFNLLQLELSGISTLFIL